MSLYFTVTAPTFTSIILCILYFSIGSLKVTKKNVVFFFGVTTALLIIMMYIKFTTIGIVFYLIIFIIFEYKGSKSIYTGILKAIIFIALIAIIDIITGYIAMLIFKFTVEQIRGSIGPNIIMYLIGILIAIIISKGISAGAHHKRLQLKNIESNKHFFIYIAITALVAYLNVTLLGTFIKVVSIEMISLLIIIFGSHCILGIVFIYMTKENMEKNMELEMHTQENKRLIDYANLLEKQHDDLRVFKHDYMNMLATIGGYIQLRDLEKLDMYFKAKILNGGEIFKEDKKLELIKKIESIPIRGMMYAKLVKAQQAQVDLCLAVTDIIPLFKMNELHVCKILGILIDNGIEATSLSKDKKLIIALSYEAKTIKVSVSNSFSGKIESINLLFLKGYSTKGEGRGLGLHTVRSLIDSQYKSTKLMTTIRENLFVQELLFPVKSTES